MPKHYLYYLALSLILCSASILNAQNRTNCSTFCHAGGMACMRACTDIYRNEKKCGEICEYGDKTCTENCLVSVCHEECDRTTSTATDANKCKRNCKERDGGPSGLLENW